MKRLIFLFAVLAAALLLSSCTSTYYAMPTVKDPASFKGMTYKQVVQTYGAPTQNVPDGEGGFILVYVGNRLLFNYSNAYANASRQLPVAQFFMNADGICESVMYDYQKSVTQYDPAATAGLMFLLM